MRTLIARRARELELRANRNRESALNYDREADRETDQAERAWLREQATKSWRWTGRLDRLAASYRRALERADATR